MESITINLAGTGYEIKEFTLAQLEEIQDALVKSSPKERNRELIAVALSEDHSEITSDKLKKMRLGSIHAVGAIVSQILAFAGYKTEEKPKGEAPAG